MNDPRFNRPSASAFPRLSKCPASFRLGQEAVAAGLAPGGSKDSAHGDAVHECLALGDIDETPVLTREQEETADRCRSQVNELLAAWGANDETPRREQRLYMMADGSVRVPGDNLLTRGGILFSGQMDGIAFNDSAGGFVWDYKTLAGEVEHAEGNLQLMALAVLAAGRWNLKSVRVAIVQPLAGKPTCADYSEEALYGAKLYIEQLVKRADQNDNTPIPGPHCRFCDARLTCPALKKEITVTAPPEIMKVNIGNSPPLALTLALDMLPAIKGYIEAVESVAKARLERGEAIPGYCLKERKGKREIGDIMAAYHALPLVPLAFMACCKASLPELESALKEAGIVPTLVAAKKLLAEKLGDNLTQKSSMVLSKTGKEIES